MDDHRHLTPHPTARWSATRLLLVGIALVGLLAMHGLSDHGTAGHAQMSMAAVGVSHATSGLGPLSLSGDPESTPATEMERGSSGGSMAGLMDLCLAVVVLLLVLLPTRRRHALLVARSSVRTTAPRWRPRERPPAPPDLNVLSILRC